MSSNAARLKYMIKFPPDSTRYRFRFPPNLPTNQVPQAPIQVASQASMETAAQVPMQAAPQTPTQAALQSPIQPPLCRLPFELIIPIFAHLPYTSQIALGLTNKHLAHILEAVDLNLPGGTAPTWDKRALLAQLEGWMPRNYKLCSYCTSYRPIDGVSWRHEEHLTARPLRKGSDRVIYEKMQADLRRDKICRSCVESMDWHAAWETTPSTTRYGWRKREGEAIMEGVDALIEG